MSVVEVSVQLGDVVRFGQAEGWLGRRFVNVLIQISDARCMPRRKSRLVWILSLGRCEIMSGFFLLSYV